jgi:ubiquitin carboxyl-terminal hydrolase 5/13
MCSPYSPGGLFVNLVSFQGYGAEYVTLDVEKSHHKLYLHIKFDEVFIPENTATEEKASSTPIKLGINVEGGFQTSSNNHFEVMKQYSLAVWNNNKFDFILLPNTDLPEFISNICQTIIQHDGMKLRTQVIF